MKNIVVRVFPHVKRLIDQRLNIVSFFLAGLGLSALLIFVNQVDPDGEFHFNRGLASWYVFLSSVFLVLLPNSHRALRTVAWACFAAGCLFFAFDSAFWYFWVFAGAGSVVQTLKVALDRENCGWWR